MKNTRIPFFILLLSAPIGVCGCEPPTPPTTISGTIERWGRGVGQITAQVQMGVMATGPIASDGSFTITLPDEDTLAPFLTPADAADGCSGTVVVSPPGAARGELSFGYTAGAAHGAPRLAHLVSGGTVIDETTVVYIYADQDFTKVGEKLCGINKFKWDVSFKKGWNTILRRTQGGRNLGSGLPPFLYTSSNGAISPDFVWWPI